jgi:hypothetical protein
MKGFVSSMAVENLKVSLWHCVRRKPHLRESYIQRPGYPSARPLPSYLLLPYVVETKSCASLAARERLRVYSRHPKSSQSTMSCHFKQGTYTALPIELYSADVVTQMIATGLHELSGLGPHAPGLFPRD